MGYAYTGLIPAAVLFNNPGVNKREFAELLNKTSSFDIVEFSRRARWNILKVEPEDTSHHDGLHGLAGTLKLKETEKFKSLERRKNKDEHGLIIAAPSLYVKPCKKNGVWMSPKFEVTVHTKNEVSDKVEEISNVGNCKYKIGDVIQHWAGLRHYLIEKILNVKKLKSNGYGDDCEYEPSYSYKLLAREFRELGEVQKFSSLEDLIKAFPRFDPEFMYDFSVESGGLCSGPFNADRFMWVNRADKYYLDPETFNHIPATLNIFSGYTDLILTAEAVKNRAWKLLSRRGLKHLHSFLKRFPDSRLSYERAVWDSHTSLWAKSQGMSYTDLLRARCLGSAYRRSDQEEGMI